MVSIPAAASGGLRRFTLYTALGLGGVERGTDRHHLPAGKQLGRRPELHALLRVRGVRVQAGSVILFIVRRRRERS
jgi:hypothetical protein